MRKVILLIFVTGAILLTGCFLTLGGPTNTEYYSVAPVWTGPLPDAPGADGNTATYAYLGLPNYQLEMLDGYPVVLLTNSLSDSQRAGWSLKTNFYLSDFRYEVRFNSLVQSPTTSIDAFIEIWILDASNSNRYDIVSLFGGSYGSDRRFRAGSPITGASYDQSYPYTDNTFYRLVLQGNSTNDIMAELYDDSGNLLEDADLGHTTSVFGSGFTIGISHAMDRPLGTYPSQVAINYASLTTTNVASVVPTTSTRGIQVSWRSQVGEWYQMQVQTFFGAPWQNYGNPVPGTETNATAFLPLPQANGPYRVEELP